MPVTSAPGRDAGMDGIEDLIDVHELVLEAAHGLPESGPRLRGVLGEPLPLVLAHGDRLRVEVRERLRALLEEHDAAAAPVLTLSGEAMPGDPETLAIRLAVGRRAELLHLPVAGAVPLL